jgi:hypothetical protein
VTRLEELPARIDDLQLQILQFREETRGECSAVRREMREGFDGVNRQFEQTRSEMRVLHEEVISRIALLGEVGGPRRRAVSPRTRKRR